MDVLYTFARGIAMSIQGESLKAQVYVDHMGSLGGLREEFVRGFIRDKTPDRSRVGTGIIRLTSDQTSRQCDVLVYDSHNFAPHYRYDDFVVVSPQSAKLVVEVKSTLGKDTIKDVVEVHKSICPLWHAASPDCRFIPTFCYSLQGCTVQTFMKNIATHCTPECKSMSLPALFAVESRHYIGVNLVGQEGPAVFCAFDISKIDETYLRSLGLTSYVGIETSLFLGAYDAFVSRRSEGLMEFVGKFQGLPIPSKHIYWIDNKGKIHTGIYP